MPGDHTPHVKHSMRKSPYLISLILLLAATALTVLNIKVPSLVRVKIRSPGPTVFETKYGLFERCARQVDVPALLRRATPLLTPIAEPYDTGLKGGKKHRWQCERFPTRSECAQFGEGFCVAWSTAGYTVLLALVPCFFALISLLFIFLHRGKRLARARARRQQWKLVSGAMLVHALLQVASVALILREFWTDERFARGARLGASFTFGVAAAIVSLSTFGFLTFTGIAARRGEPWAAGRSARQARRHKRTRSGRVVSVPEGTHIPPEARVTVGEVVSAAEHDEVDEHSALLAGHEGSVAGGGSRRATDQV
ncbi:uncharacterized protein LOC62_04G006150 [Vanrija pseudolonga]|uniref:Uncharacterized protein n=1 Tax=Vanrija pseudolonga TaxID=143232 RepID=A0AAF0Y9J0_9TREE|nr:hypothetical protein LOC62_04G006150 [Vanrija pseudolonga]